MGFKRVGFKRVAGWGMSPLTRVVGAVALATFVAPVAYRLQSMDIAVCVKEGTQRSSDPNTSHPVVVP